MKIFVTLLKFRMGFLDSPNLGRDHTDSIFCSRWLQIPQPFP